MKAPNTVQSMMMASSDKGHRLHQKQPRAAKMMPEDGGLKPIDGAGSQTPTRMLRFAVQRFANQRHHDLRGKMRAAITLD